MKYLIITMIMFSGCAGPTGTPGTNGATGATGLTGDNGHNSLVALAPSVCPNGGVTVLVGTDLNDDNILDSYEVAASATICNGTDGQDAPPTSFTPVALVNPCGDAPGIHNEVFLRLANGTLLASFSDNDNGKNTRFSVLTTGNYVTTDSDNCYFSVDASGNIYNEHH